MASLTGQLVAETYKALLKTIDNDILTASEKQITDGFGGGSNVFIDSQGFLRANKYKVTNGLATQFLKADGSLDANTYLTGITSSQIITALGYTPVTNARTLTINGTTYDLSANRSWTIAGTAAVWGNISGTLSDQTDLQNALNAKFNNPTGTISQYIRGDGTLATLPSAAVWGNITGTLSAQTDLQSALDAKFDDPTGNSTQYIDGSGNLQTFPTMLSSDNLIKLVRNQSGATMSAGTIVYINGATGNKPTIAKALATSDATSAQTYGMVQADIANNADGYIVVIGNVNNLNTHSLTEGAQLYLSATTAGAWTTTKQYAPAHLVYVGIVLRSHPTQGIVGVKIQNGYEMDELHDVSAQTPSNNDGLFYETSTSLWKNKSITDALGFVPQRLDKMVSNLLASSTEYPNSNAVIAALALKANAENPVFTGNMTISGAEPKLYFTDTDQNPDYFIGADAGYFKIYDQTAGATRFQINSDGNISTGTGKSITAGSFIKDGGIASQFLKADGSIDSSTYVSSSVLADYLLSATAASTYQRLDKMVSNLLASSTEYPNSNAVIAALALKADAANPVFTGNMTISGAEPKLYFTDTDQNPDYFIGVDAGYFRIYNQTAGQTKFVINTDGDATFTNSVTASSIIKSGGTSSQYLMADGSVSTGPSLSGYLLKSGGTMTGQLNLWAEQYQTSPTPSYGINAQNSDIIGINALYYNDNAEPAGEGINFWRSAGYWDTLRAESGVLFFAPNRATGESLSGYTVYHSGNLINPTTGSGTSGYIPKYTGSTTLGNSLIYDNGSKVAIGNSAPDTRFQVVGSHTGGRGILELFSADDCLIALRKASGTSGLRFQSTIGTDNWFFGDLTSGDIVLQENFSTTRFTMFKGGNFVIGNGGDAGYKLDVNGTGRFSGQVTNTNGMLLNVGATGTNSNLNYTTFTNGVYSALNSSTPSEGVGMWSDNQGNGMVGSLYNNNASSLNLVVRASSSTGGLVALKLSGLGGAATFSSSLRIGGDFTYYNGSNLNAIITSGAADKGRMYLYSSGTADIGLQSGGNSWFLNSLGIGTNSPQVKLNTFLTASLDGVQIRAETDVSSVVSYLGMAPSVLEFYRNIDTGVDLTIQTKVGAGSSGGNIVFAPNGGTSLTPVPRMRIFKSGRVAIGDTGANGLLQLTGSHPSGYGMLNMNSTDACIISMDGSSYDVRIRYKYQGTDKWFAGMSTTDNWELQTASAIAAIKANQSGDVFIYDKIAIGTSTFTGSAKFLLGTYLSAGSGAIAQFNGFIRVRNQLILHNDSNTALDAYLICTGSGTMATGGTFTATAFYESSDKRLKTLIDGSAQVSGIENIEAKLYEKNGKIELGYFAQDVEKLMPYAIEKNADGFLNLSYREVHTAKIARLEKRVAELEKQLNIA